MIAIYVDPAVNKYLKQIQFSIEYLMNMSGFFWKYLEAETELHKNDVILYYSSSLPDQDYVDWMIENYTLIFIPFDKHFYLPGGYSGDVLKNNLKLLNYEVELPYISAKKNIKTPINIKELAGSKYCLYEFDLIGNLFFHLADDERNHIKKKDQFGNLDFKSSAFHNHFETPYINFYIEIFTNTVKELIETKNQWGIRKCLWPADQPFAVLISHNLDKLQKWNVGTILYSFIEFFLHLLTFRFVNLFRNFVSIIKYLFTNEEDYWNFYTISTIEKKYKFQSTWYVGVNDDKKAYYDYDFDDPDVIKELNSIIHYGSEIALLSKKGKMSMDAIKKNFDLLSTKVKNLKAGIKHKNYFDDCESHDVAHKELGVKYDSSRCFPDKNAFYYGFALPYPLYTGNNTYKSVIQLPITYTDELLKLNKYKYIPFEEAMEQIKEVIRTIKRAKGLFHINISNSLFYDIRYLPRLYEYFLEQCKSQNAYVSSCSGLVEWLECRDKVSIREEENRIIITFLANIDQITFEIIGDRYIINVFGGSSSYKKNVVQFVNAVKDLEVEIKLSSGEKECRGDFQSSTEADTT